MSKHFYFISGLPRSGSTLLSSLLRQNPAIYARVASPVFELVHAVQPKLSRQSEFYTFYDASVRRAVLKGLFESFYSGIENRVIFDSNRLWTTRLPLLLELFPDTRLVCMVRDVQDILNSFERQFASNPLETTAAFAFTAGSSIYSRMDQLMNSEVGLVGLAWLGLREAWFGPHADRLVVVDYDRLVAAPRDVLGMLGDTLRLPPHVYNFDDVSYSESAYDANLGMPGLHSVRKTIAKVAHEMRLPPDLLAKNSGHAFWKTPQTVKQSLVML
jgi:sulfotransferase